MIKKLINLPPFIPAIGWLVLISFLLMMPGSAFPKETWLSKIYFDKVAHVAIFFVLVVLWCRVFMAKKLSARQFLLHSIILLLLSIFYGIGMEYIQRYFVLYRSFDVGDIAANISGSFLGYFVSFLFLRKRNA